MAIRWDALLAGALARELDQRLRGSRVRRLLLDPVRGGASIYLRDATLAFDRDVGVALLDPASPPPEALPLPARVTTITAPADERRLHVGLRATRGRGHAPELVVELDPARWNALLVDPESGRILRVSRGSGRGGRSRRAGAPYRPPPASREGVRGELTPERWLELLRAVPAAERETALVRTVAYTSRISAPSFLGRRAGQPGTTDGRTPESTDEELLRGYELWRELRAFPPTKPHLLRVGGAPQPYPYPLPHLSGDPCPSLLDAFRLARGSAPLEAVLLPGAVVEALAERTSRAKRRLTRLERELASSPDPEELRARGSLLLARLSRIPRGARTAVLEGFDGEPVTVELDPALPPHENAARVFARASRAERARELLPGLIDEARARVEELGLALDGARRGTADPDTVRRVAGLAPPEGGGRRAGAPGTLPYRRFRSSGGLEIRVGKGARDNDALTFRHSGPNDVWLHARHAAGAHVILRWTGAEAPPQRDLREAAVLAAVHSRARTSGTVAVDWTRRKHVRKPRKSPPGAVLPDRVRTVFVEPDPDLAASLEEKEDGGG